ncbi:DsbA family protein [Patescibacteria group bacterium]|nr:DsbA family protein [Patescibacteria group bacterium]
MTKERKILILLLVLLIFFVAALVIRLITTNLAIKSEQEYLLRLNQQAANENTLSVPISRVSDPLKGKKEAIVNIVEFASFTCSYCAEMSEILNELSNKFPDKVKVTWKDFVDLSGQTALRAAVAARCAQAQGKFWEFHDALFTNQANLNDNFYLATAQSLSLDQSKFQNCFENQQTLGLVQDNFNEGLALEIDGTPYLFIDDQRFSGLTSYEELETIINRL